MDDPHQADRQAANDLAHSMVLREVIMRLFPDDAERFARRDLLCDAIERLYGDDKITLADHAHPRLQMAIATIEGIFGPR